MNSINDLWSTVLDMISSKYTSTSIATWFSDCKPVAIKESTFIIYTPTDFKRKIITNRFGTALEEVLTDLFSSPFTVQILCGDETIESTSSFDDVLPEMEGYTFDNFIVGNSNKFAHAAAVAVTDKPGQTYNPLFIYGNSGLGKTHLLLAIGHDLLNKNPNMNVAYIKGDDFTNELIQAISRSTTNDFHEKYRNVELLLVDDIQFIAGKTATQEEFFHTFNTIYESGHQIVITSDRPPMEMTTLDDRLRTRFEGGLMADIQPPDLETRMAIIRNKASQLGLLLSDDVVLYIAENITSNIRQIEGVIKRLTAYKEILDDTITIDSIKRAISDVIRVGTFIPSPDSIINATANYFNMTEADLTGVNRTKDLIRTLTNLSLPDIGKIFNRNHSTVLVSIRKIESQMEKNPELAAVIRDITSNINSVL